jgi:hypothetical protein
VLGEEARLVAVVRGRQGGGGDKRVRRGWAIGEGEEDGKVEGKRMMSGSHT